MGRDRAEGRDAEFRELILSSLSSRVRKMIEQELNNGQPTRHAKSTMPAAPSPTWRWRWPAAARSRFAREEDEEMVT